MPISTSSSTVAVADADQAVADPREQALERSEHARLQATEIAPQHVTVVGVDDHRPRAWSHQRRDAAQHAGLRRVGVDDVGTEGPDRADQRDQGAEIPQRTDVRSERVEAPDLDPCEVVLLLSRPDGTRDQEGFVAARIESAAEQRGLMGGPAEVHPRDHSQNADFRSIVGHRRYILPRCIRVMR